MVRPQIMDPCQSADKITFENADLYHPASDMFPADKFIVSVDMKISRIKVIEQKPAYELQALVGNSGGYIGLLLGKITTYTRYVSKRKQCSKH